MLSLPFVRENRDLLERAIRDKAVDVNLDRLLELDAYVTSHKAYIENRRKLRNDYSDLFKRVDPEERERLREKSKAISGEIADFEHKLKEFEEELRPILLGLPNVPWTGAPVGSNEDSNVVVRTEGTPPAFDFTPRDHVELVEANDWADLARITKVAGARTYCLKGRLAVLEQALLFWALQRMQADGFTPVSVPAIAKEEAFVATGHFPGGKEDAYAVPRDELFLAGTGEIALTSLHAGEILDAARLPILYAGISPCFRREAGSAGRDVRGLLRVHQFVKVEQYVICRDDEAESAAWHQRLLGNAEAILRALEIPYQVIETSTGDMGLGKFRMNDLESWVPSLAKYRETHSCSTLHDWQARRANLRWRDEEGRVRFCHTLNNTALASPRILVPLLENGQEADGRVRLPEALHGLMGAAYL